MPTKVQLALCVKLFSQWTSSSIISNYLIKLSHIIIKTYNIIYFSSIFCLIQKTKVRMWKAHLKTSKIVCVPVFQQVSHQVTFWIKETTASTFTSLENKSD